MEKLLHFENEWCNNIDANKVSTLLASMLLHHSFCTV